MITAKFVVGERCKCLHHYVFRSGEPFTIVSIATVPHEEYQKRFRYVYVVRYDDGVLDAIPVEKEGGYEMVTIDDKEERGKA